MDSNEDYKKKINEAFYNSDFTNMSQNLQLLHFQEAKLQNSKRKNISKSKSKENYKKEYVSNSNDISMKKISKLSQKERKEVLKNKDFNFDLGQEFLGSRYVAYQSKDLKYSLKNAKEVEKSLMMLNLEESDKGIFLKYINSCITYKRMKCN